MTIETADEHSEQGKVYKNLHVTLLSLAGILFEIIALVCLVGVLFYLIESGLHPNEENTCPVKEVGTLNHFICEQPLFWPIALFIVAIVAAPIGFVLLRSIGSAPPLSFKLSGLDTDTIRNIELFIGVLTLVVIASQSYLTLEQTRNTADNVEIIRKNTEFDEHKLINQHLQLINRILIDPNDKDKLYRKYAESRAEVLSFMLLADYETFYEMSANGVMKKETWCRVYEYARLAVKHDETLKKVWSEKGYVGKTPEFRKFFECLIIEVNSKVNGKKSKGECLVYLENGGDPIDCSKSDTVVVASDS